MITLDTVTKVYRQGTVDVHAVRGVTCTVEKGEFLTIMGPSGSGKSTLLHLIGGLDRPTAGRVLLSGADLGKLSDKDLTLFRRRKIGIVFQFFNLLPTLTAEENVALPLLLEGKRMKDLRPRVEELLELVGLLHRREHRPDALSGGEMQRIAVARALVHKPELLLADEPTGNLDSKAGGIVLDLLREAVNQFGYTIVMVTHDQHAAGYGHRTIHIQDGLIERDERSGQSPS